MIQDETLSQALILSAGSCYEQAAISAEGHRLAFLAAGGDGGNVLRILEVPGLEVVGEVDLGDTELRDLGQMIWSPDGEALAYVVAPRGEPAQLHAFDVGHPTGRLLESRPGEIHIMGWSPDSRWLVAFSGQGRLEDVWAVSLAGSGTRDVFQRSSSSDTFYWGSILGWTARSTFVTEDGPGEGCAYALREFNLDTGTDRVLYDSSFVDPQLDPASRTVFLGIREPGMCVYGLEPGIYRIPLAAPSPRVVVQGLGWDQILWLGPLGPFGVHASSPAGIQVYTADGRRGAFFEEAAELFPSPDGAWAVAHMADGGVALFEATGTGPRRATDQASTDVAWLPNSSAFYVLEDSGAVYRMAVEGQDRPTHIADSVIRILGLLTP